MEYDDLSTRDAAWDLIVKEAERRGQGYLATLGHKAAFEAGWEAHKDAMKRLQRDDSWKLCHERTSAADMNHG